jgi:HPt (histidine-containing phosphotransfer) domain-containing protein
VNGTEEARDNTIPVFDLAYLREVCGDDDAFLDELINSFIETNEGVLAALLDAVMGGDPGGTRAAAHALKGSALSIGGPALAAASQTLEQLGIEGAMEETPRALARVQAEYVRLCEALQAHVDRAL